MAGSEPARIYDVVGRFSKSAWKTFTRMKLGLTDIQIEECEENYRGDMKEQRYQMVREWQISNGRRATIERLEELAEMPNIVPTQSQQPPSTIPSQSYREQPNAPASSVSPLSTPVSDAPEPNWLEPSKQLLLGSKLHKRREIGSANSGKRESDGANSGRRENSSENLKHCGAQPITTDPSNQPRAFSGNSPGQKKKDNIVSGASGIQSPPHIAVQDGKRSGSFKQKLKKAVGLEKKPSQRNSFNPPSLPNKNYCEKVDKVKVKKTSDENYHEIRKRDFYPIKRPKGCVLILNNTFKSDEKKTRHGSGKDVNNMEKLWLQVGCEIYKGRPQCDKTAFEMKKLLGEMTQQGQYSFIVIVIMTHGGRENGHLIFKGADDKSVGVDEIEEMFNNENAKELCNIPKLFIFQFCRGKSLDKGVACDSFDDDVKTGMKSICSAMETTSTSNVQTDGGGSLLPSVSDMLFAYATQPDFAALRHPENGSWFINAITNVFMNYANVEDVDEMLTRVNRSMKEMSGTYEEIDKHGQVVVSHPIKAMSSTRKNLCKKLYLLPGL